MIACTVQGGTGAGSKMARREVPRSPWACTAGHVNQGWAATCFTSGCREKRPKGR